MDSLPYFFLADVFFTGFLTMTLGLSGPFGFQYVQTASPIFAASLQALTLNTFAGTLPTLVIECLIFEGQYNKLS
jgi:hypothetical protein